MVEDGVNSGVANKAMQHHFHGSDQLVDKTALTAPSVDSKDHACLVVFCL